MSSQKVLIINIEVCNSEPDDVMMCWYQITNQETKIVLMNCRSAAFVLVLQLLAQNALQHARPLQPETFSYLLTIITRHETKIVNTAPADSPLFTYYRKMFKHVDFVN